MHVQLSDPTLVGSLLSFLRSKDCVVEQIGAALLDVWCPPVERNGSRFDGCEATCRSCGAAVADTLGRLGSLRCHDCRDEGHESLLASVYARANGNGHEGKARAELSTYLALWQIEHPGAQAVIG